MSMPTEEEFLAKGFAVFSNGSSPNPVKFGYQPFRVFKPTDFKSMPLYIKYPTNKIDSETGRVMDFYSAQYLGRASGLTEVVTVVSDDGSFGGVKTITSFHATQASGWRSPIFSTRPFSGRTGELYKDSSRAAIGPVAKPPAEFVPFVFDSRFQVRQLFNNKFTLHRRIWAYPEEMTLVFKGDVYRVLYRLEPVLEDLALPASADPAYNTHRFAVFLSSGGYLRSLGADFVTNIRGG